MSDEDDNNDDMDAFLISVESKLRSPFTSLELCKLIQSSIDNGSSSSMHHRNMKGKKGSLTPRRHVKLISKAFDQMAKPVKMRVLISLFCLDPLAFSADKEANSNGAMVQEDDEELERRRKNYHKVERSILHVLENAELDDDEWVRILAGIVKGKIFYATDMTNLEDGEDVDESLTKPCRGAAAEKLLEKSCGKILKEVCGHASAVHDQAEKLYQQAEDQDDEYDTLTTLVDRTVSDRAPLFVTMRYALLSTPQLRKVLPDALSNDHFGVSSYDLPILMVDDEEEKLKMEEDVKDMERKRGMEQRLKSMQEQKQKQQLAKAGRTSLPTAGGRGGPMGGRGLMGRGGRMMGRGNMGRGMTINKSTPFMRAPIRTRPTPSGRNLGRMTNGGPGGGGGGVKTTTTFGGNSRASKKNVRSCKMKSIDASEVSTDWREDEEDERFDSQQTDAEKRAAKRRKIFEKFNQGSKPPVSQNNNTNRNGIRPPTNGHGDGAFHQHQQAFGSNSNNHNSQPLHGNEQGFNNNGFEPDQSSDPPFHENESNNNDQSTADHNPTDKILSKSNKISPEDRYRVEQFFSSQFNPTPELSVYKMKLNEEKNQQSQDNGSVAWVKETLYLELDYTTLKYKMSKKLKNYN